MLQMFNLLDGLYLREIGFLIDTIIKYQSRKESAAKIGKINREKHPRNKKRNVHLRLLKKTSFMNYTTRTSQATSKTSH